MATKKTIPASGPHEPGETPPPLAPPVDFITKLELFLEKRWRSVVAVLAVLVAAVIVYFYVKYKNENAMTLSNKAFTAAATRSDFEAVVKGHPGTVAAGSALYAIADRQVSASDLDGASATLQKFVTDFPDHPLHYDALVGLGGVAEKQGDLDKASGYFKKVVEAGDKSSKAALADMLDIEILVAKGELEAAQARYETFGVNHAGSPFVERAIERLAAVETRIKMKGAPKAPVEPEDPPEPEPAKTDPAPTINTGSAKPKPVNAETETTGTEATDTEATDTEATEIESTDTEATDIEATETEATETEATDTEADNSEAGDPEE